MMNFSFNFGSFMGFTQVLLAVAYFVISIIQVVKSVRSRKSKSGKNTDLIFRIWQLTFIPIILLASGLILLFNSWRLDPLLQFQQFLMMIVASYLISLDLMRSFTSRHSRSL